MRELNFFSPVRKFRTSSSFYGGGMQNSVQEDVAGGKYRIKRGKAVQGLWQCPYCRTVAAHFPSREIELITVVKNDQGSGKDRKYRWREKTRRCESPSQKRCGKPFLLPLRS